MGHIECVVAVNQNPIKNARISVRVIKYWKNPIDILVTRIIMWFSIIMKIMTLTIKMSSTGTISTP